MRIEVRRHGQLVDTRAFDASQSLVTIGRDAGNDVVLDDPDRVVSRHHAVLVVARDAKGEISDLYLRDLGSVAGTYVLDLDEFGRKLPKAVVQSRISSKEEILVGAYMLSLAEGSTAAEPFREAPDDDGDSGTEATRDPEPQLPGLGVHGDRGLRLARAVGTYAQLCANDIELFDWVCDLLKKFFACSVVRVRVRSEDDKWLFPGSGDLKLPLGSFDRLLAAQTVISRNRRTIAIPLREGDGRYAGFIGLGPDGHHGRGFDEADIAFAATLAAVAMAGRATATQQRERARPWPMYIVGMSPAFRTLQAEIGRAARSSLRVLLLGATGTGKTAVAAEIHRRSGRARGPFVAPQNITGASPTALSAEEELFGVAAGAGGFKRLPPDGIKGAFERAHDGTLFIDELDALEPDLIARLKVPLGQPEMGTRLSIVRLGGIDPVEVDVRLICATNKDLDAEVRVGRMAADFPRRVAQQVIEVPPLDIRKEDIPLLVHFMADQYAAARGLPPRLVSNLVVRRLMQLEHPENVGGLLNRVRAAFDRAVGPVLTLEDFGFADGEDDGLDEQADTNEVRRTGVEPVTDESSVRTRSAPAMSYRERIARDALDKAGGNITVAARILGVHRNTMLNWMDRYGINRDRQGAIAAGQQTA